MGKFVSAGEMLEIKVRIDLCGTDAGVSEQLLDAAQVVAGFEQVGRERMAEQMRVDVLRHALDAAGPG